MSSAAIQIKSVRTAVLDLAYEEHGPVGGEVGYAGGDPTLDAIEAALAKKPTINVPTISLSGADDGVSPPPPEDTDSTCFTGPYERRVLPGIGHNIPQEAPTATLSALMELLRE